MTASSLSSSPAYDAPAAPPSRQHLTALDGVRGAAILAVMVFHLCPRPWGHDGLSIAITRLYSFGWAGVDLFFVLSGFLITGILLDAKGSTSYFRTFYARRTLRIFPLYYGLLCFLFLLLPAFHVHQYDTARRDQAWFWLYASNIADAIKQFPYRSLGHLWSLAVEEQFYLIWPVLVLISTPRGFVRLCWGCIGLALVARLVCVYGLNRPEAAYTLTFCRIDGLACGALVAASTRFEIPANPLGFWRSRALWLVLAATMSAVVLLSRSTQFEPRMLTAGISALALLFATTVAISATPGARLGRLFSWRPLIFLGKYSYALYLFHPLVYSVSREVFEKPHRWMTLSVQSSQWASAAATFVASIAIAWVSWHVFEGPILSLKRFFPTNLGRRADVAKSRERL